MLDLFNKSQRKYLITYLVVALALGIIALLIEPLWVFVVLICAIFILIFAYYPAFGLYLMIFFYPFTFLEIRYAALNVPYVDVIAILLLIGFALRRIYDWKVHNKTLFSPKKDFPGLIIYLCLLIAGFLSLTNTPDYFFWTAFKNVFRPLGFFYIMFVILPYNIVDKKKYLDTIFKILFWLGLSVAVMGIWSFATFPATNVIDKRAVPISIFGLKPLGTNHNQLAELLIAVIPFALIFLWKEKNLLMRKLILLSILLMAFVNLLTFSRSGWIALFLELAILAFIQYRSQMRALFRNSVILLLILSPIIVYMYIFSMQSGVLSSTASRVMLIDIAWQAFKAHPLFGNGMGIFPTLVGQNPIFLLEYGVTAGAHGFIQHLAAEIGIFGLGAFIALLVFIFIRLIKSYRKHKKDPYWSYVILSAIIAFVGVVSFQLFQTSFLTAKMWVPLGIGLIITKIADKYGKTGY